MGIKESLKLKFISYYKANKTKLTMHLAPEDGWDERIEHARKFLEGFHADMSDEDVMEKINGERFWDWMDEWDNIVTEEKNKLMIYRCISVDDPDEFAFFLANGEMNPEYKYKGIGVYWAWDEARAQCHWGSGGKGTVVWALVDEAAINIPATIELNMNPSLGRDEAEIRLKEGAKVEIYAIEPYGRPGDDLIYNDTDHPVFVNAKVYPILASLLKQK